MTTSTSRVRRRVIVHGAVQGVFFRDTCRSTATRHGIAGWVRNRPDGTVEASFEGPPEQVQSMVDWAGVGPPMARVDHVEVIDEPAEGGDTFEIRH